MLKWDTVKSEFAWEGSWRDICVRDTGLREWGAATKAVRAAGIREQFMVDGVTARMPDDVARVFEKRSETGALWTLFVTGVQLNCHFFDPSEIEFDLDPREVTGQAQLDGIIGFMLLLSEATISPTLLTPENMHHGPIIRTTPSGEIDYISSEGFFEEAARGRL